MTPRVTNMTALKTACSIFCKRLKTDNELFNKIKDQNYVTGM